MYKDLSVGICILAAILFFLGGYVYGIGQNLSGVRSTIVQLTKQEFRDITNER